MTKAYFKVLFTYYLGGGGFDLDGRIILKGS
jgi:hypothetical protein